MHQNKAFLNGNGNCNCHCCGSAAPRPAPPALFDLSLPIVTVTTTRNTCNMEYLSGRLSILWLLGLSLLLFKTGSTEAQSKRASRVTSSRSFGTNVKPTSSNGISFDCPEEFGYYPHPSDCTQYYVCVFGGALLESCTGGLMYSHELQTCDWPRNVGCELVDTSSERGPARSQGQSQTHTQAQHVPSRVRFGAAFSSPGGTQKAPTVAPQYHRSPPQVIQAQVQHIPPPPPELRVPPNPVITSRGQPKPLIESQEDIAKLYAEAQETLPPVEEEESDRQQRVYRGQPSTVSQVQRDRDGIIHQASINAIPQSGKIASYAFGTAYRVESSSPSSLGAPPPANVFVQPTPQAPSPQLEPNRNYYNASIFNHGGGYQPPQQQQQQQQQQLQPTPFQQATPQQQHQLQPQASPHPYDSSYYSVYDDDIDLYRDIEYQQQQQQDQQQPSVPQYQPTVRQQQPHSTYRPLELSATPTPPQKSSYSNQQTLAYSSDYDEDINAQIEQENLYDQPTRSPQRAEQVAIQRLDTRPSPSTTLSPTTPATRPDVLTYYDTVTTPNAPEHGPADYSYSSSAEYAFGSAEDYDLSERTLTRAKSTARTYTDDYDLIANVVGPTSKSTMAPPTRTQNTKSTSALSRNPSKSSITNTKILEVTKSTTTTTTTTTTTPFPSTTTTKLASSKAHAIKPYKQHVPNKSKTTTQASSTPPTTTPSSIPPPNPTTYSSNPFLKSKLQNLAKSLVHFVSNSQTKGNNTGFRQVKNLTSFDHQPTIPEPVPDQVPAQTFSPVPEPSSTQWPLVEDHVETVFDESQNVHVQTAEPPRSRSFETSTSAKFLDFINAAAYGTSPRGNLLNAVPNKFVGRDFPYRERDYSFESSSKEPELQRKRIQTYITSDVAPESFKVPANGEVRPQPEGMESASTTRPSKPIKHSLQSGSHGFSLRVEQNESESNVSEPIFAEKKSQPSTTTAKSPTTPVDSSQEYVDIIPTTYAPPLRIWRNGRPTIQQAYYRPTTTSSSTTTTSTTTSTSPPTTSNDNVHSSSTIRTTTTPRALGPPSTERYVVPGQTYTARANYFKDTLNRVTANPATRFVSPYKSLENLLQEDRQYQYHQLRTTARPRYTNAPAFPPFLHTTSKPAKNLFMTTAIRNTSQDVLATMATGNARNFSVSDAILSTFSPQRPAPSMLRTTTMATTTSTSTEPLPPEMTTTAAPTTVSAVIASSPIRVSQSPMRPRGRSRYTAATLNNVGDSVDEPTTYAPKFRLPAGFETSQFPKRKPQRVRVISNQRTSFGEPTAKPHEKYEAYKAALQAKDSAYSSHSALSKSLKHKSIENEASVADEPRAEALISQPLEARQQNSLEQGGTAIAFSSTEHVVAITDRPTVKFLYSNKYRQQTAERTLAESLQNAGYIASANGPAQKFRSANVLDQLRQFLAGSDSTSNSDESGTSQFVDEYSLPEIKAAVDEIKQLYMVTDRPATSTLQTSTTTLRPTTTPIIPPSALRSTTATVTSSVRQEANQSKAYSFPSTLKVLSTDSALTARATQSTPDVSTTRTPKDPPVYPTPAPNISTATATPSPFAPHTARASRVNNVIKSSIAAAALGPSTSTYQPPVSAGKAQKLQFGFAPNNKNHQISSNHKGAAASASVKCSDSTLNAKCNEIPLRNNNRNRGNAMYANQDRDVLSTPNRGTHPPRTRPTLKPSGTIVSKAQEFVDIYRYPPTRPDPIYPQPTPDKTAAKCRKDVCLLPDCYCGGKDIPGDLPVESIPQIVLLTFDDSVNDLNKQLYTDLFEKGRVNPNGCPITATFYVSHEWTDYSQVQNLYADGHEMASHTVSHSFGEQFSQKKWTREIAGQREILAAYGGVKLSDVRGMRAPFLSVGGNKMYKMLYDSNFTYDSSMPVYENRPPSWPYTLDYKIFHDCMIPPCPTRSYPGVWQVPMVMWQDLNGGRCSMGDACSNPSDADGVTKMIMKNFERHYTTNRAPFGLFYHAAWFTQPHHKEGFIKFLDAINAMQDVWIITNWQALQWVRDPTPTSRINSFQPFQCDYSDRPKRCNNPKVCNLWHKSGVRYMKTCQPCPDIYPWTGKSGIRSSRIDNEVEEPAA
nr:mucin-5AC isoform X6 [Drosophila suzukii]